jgi:hypothetical protein
VITVWMQPVLERKKRDTAATNPGTGEMEDMVEIVYDERRNPA